MKHRCEECNGSIRFEKEEQEYRCENCGVITDSDGAVIYDVTTMFDL